MYTDIDSVRKCVKNRCELEGRSASVPPSVELKNREDVFSPFGRIHLCTMVQNRKNTDKIAI